MVGGATALYGAVSNSGKSTASGSGSNQAYIGNDRQGMDTNFQGAYGNYQNLSNQTQNNTSPEAYQTYQGMYNNPQANAYMSGAQNSANMYGQQAGSANTASGQQYQAANQLYQQAFDPQTSLYNQQLGQLNDATNASEYSRGIASSPYGASITANADSNFQNQWQNQQLGREAQGVQAMNGANQGAMGLGQNSAQMYGLQGSTPYNAQNTIYGNQGTAINNYQASQQPYMTQQNQLQSNSLGYMNGAQSAQNQAFNQNQTNQNNLNNSLSQLSGPMQNAFGSMSNAYQNYQSTPSMQDTVNYNTPSNSDVYNSGASQPLASNGIDMSSYGSW